MENRVIGFIQTLNILLFRLDLLIADEGKDGVGLCSKVVVVSVILTLK